MWNLLFFIALGLVSFSTLSWRRQIIRKRWRKKLALDQHESIYNQLYTDVHDFVLSKAARVNHDAFEYTYGHISFESYIALLSLCHPNSSTIFYDLGSGTGRAVIACTMVFNTKKSYGIELFSPLHECAQVQQHHLSNHLAYHQKASHIEFQCKDLLKTHFADATLLFISATAFLGQTWLSISKHMEHVKPGTLVITISKTLNSPLFKTNRSTLVIMSWGITKAFIQERIDTFHE